MTAVIQKNPESIEKTTSSQRLRTTMAANRLSFTWLGVHKTLDHEQKSQAADTFGAEREFLSAGKKLLDTSHPAFKAVTAVRSRIIQYWKGISLPYPESGNRLIRQDDIDPVTVQLTTLKTDPAEAVEGLERHYAELKRSSRKRLGRRYNEVDHPRNLGHLNLLPITNAIQKLKP